MFDGGGGDHHVPPGHLDLQGAAIIRHLGHGDPQLLLAELQGRHLLVVIVVREGRRQHHPGVVTTGERQIGAGEDLARPALRLHPAIRQQHQLIAQQAHLLHGVADKDHRNAALLLQALEHVGLMDAAAPVQRRKRFIQQQQIRLGQQSPGQCHPLALAAGEAVGRLGQQFGKAEPGRQRLGLPAPSPLASRQLQVAEHAQMGEETRILKHQPDAARLGQQLAQPPALPVQLVARRPVQPGDDAQQAALAAAGGAEQTEDPPQLQRQFTVEGKGAKRPLRLEQQRLRLAGVTHPNSLRCRRCSTPYTSTSITSEKPIRPPASRWAF